MVIAHRLRQRRVGQLGDGATSEIRLLAPDLLKFVHGRDHRRFPLESLTRERDSSTDRKSSPCKHRTSWSGGSIITRSRHGSPPGPHLWSSERCCSSFGRCSRDGSKKSPSKPARRRMTPSSICCGARGTSSSSPPPPVRGCSFSTCRTAPTALAACSAP